jgi:hypothetical protein
MEVPQWKVCQDRRRALNFSNTHRGGILPTWRAHLIHPDWLLNVLDALSTKVRKGDRQDLAYLIVRRTGDTHASWLRNALQSCGNVHTVAEQVTQRTPSRRRCGHRCGSSCGHQVAWLSSLRLERPAPPLRTAPPLLRFRTRQGHYRPPCSLCGPLAPNELVEDCAPFSQAFERADLVSSHETAIALNICCEDCDEASADTYRLWHACPQCTRNHSILCDGISR